MLVVRAMLFGAPDPWATLVEGVRLTSDAPGPDLAAVAELALVSLESASARASLFFAAASALLDRTDGTLPNPFAP